MIRQSTFDCAECTNIRPQVHSRVAGRRSRQDVRGYHAAGDMLDELRSTKNEVRLNARAKWIGIVLAIVTVVVATDAFAQGTTDAKPEVRAGFARVDITPPVGCRMAGNFYESLSVGVDFPLHARIMYLAGESQQSESQQSDGFVISLDVCSIGRSVSDPIRKAITQATNVPHERIIISATHNHAGPEYYGTLRDYLHEQAKQRNNGVDPAEKVDYAQLLVDRVSKACQTAKQSAVAAQLKTAETQVHGIAFNRRFHMTDGTVRMNPGLHNPKTVRVAGPVDPRLPVLWAETKSPSSMPLGMYTTFALHTATYGDLTRIGADFPGVLDERMRDKHGASFVALFGEGTAGDINHIDVTAEKRADKWSIYRTIGNRLADAVDELQPKLDPIKSPSIRWGRSVVPIDLMETDTQLLRRAPKILFAPQGEKSFLERVAAWRAMNTDRLRKRDGAKLQVEVQAVAIGNQFAIVSLPHEVFVELGMSIRQRSPFPVTAVISLAQDLDFYVPTKKAFAEGSYEVTTSSIQPGGGEQMADAAAELLRELADRN